MSSGLVHDRSRVPVDGGDQREIVKIAAVNKDLAMIRHIDRDVRTIL